MTINNIVFIDSTVTDYQTLVSQAKAGTEVIVLDNSQDGVSQITQALSGRSNLDSIQIISHGAEGAVYLGSTVLKSQSLEGYQVQLQQWGEALSDNGDILIYGCNVATGEGQAFVEQLSEIIGADVAASDDLTGNAALGGDWELEIQTGVIEATQGISQTATDNYGNVLNVYKVTNKNDSGDGSLRWAIEQAKNNNGGDVIDLRDVSGTIFVNSSLPTINDKRGDLFFIGDGDITVDMEGLNQLISIDQDNYITSFQGLTLRDGRALGGNGNGGGGGGLGAGGAIFINSGRVVIDNVSFNANEAIGGNGSFAARGGDDERDGGSSGNGGRFNTSSNFSSSFGGGAGGSGGRSEGGRGSQGGNGDFGVGGGGGGGGAGGDNDGHGGAGGSGGWGAGGGGGGGGGGDDDGSTIFGIILFGIIRGNPGNGGAGGSGGSFGGSGNGGARGADDGAPGGNGARSGGGAGLGGAIFAREQSILNITNSKFFNNTVAGGQGHQNGNGTGNAIAKIVSDSNADFNNTNDSNSVVDRAAGAGGGLGDNKGFSSIWIDNVKSLESDGTITLQANAEVGANLDVYYFITPKSVNVTQSDFVNDSFHGVFKFEQGKKSQVFNLITNDIIAENPDESFEIQLLPGTNYRLEGLNSGINNNSFIKKTVTIEDNEPVLKISTIQTGKIEGSAPRGAIDFFEIKLLKADGTTAQPNPNDNAKIKLEIGGSAVRGSLANTQLGSDYKLYYTAYNSDGSENQSRKAVSDPISGQSIYEIDMPKNATRIVLQLEDINNEIFEQTDPLTIKIVDYDNTKQFYRRFDEASSTATVQLLDNEPTVSVGKVVNPTEGQGFGSTIAGLGQAINLANNQFIAVAADSILNLSASKQFTQEAWIFANIADNNKHGILGYQSGTAQGYPSISIINQKDIEIGFGDGSNWNSKTITNAINANTWNHIAATYDGTDYKLYVNAVEIFSTSDFQGKNIAPTEQLEIGKVENTYFEGAIDEVRIWNVARNAGQIQNLLISELEGNEDGLVGYWNFNGNNKNKAVNSSKADSSPTVNTYINNPSPQIGYIEVNLDKPFEGPQGLWVKYEINPDSALNLKGPNDYVKVKNNGSLNLTNEITIETWINLKNSSSDQKIIGKTDIGTGYVLGIIDGKLYPEFWDSNKKNFSAKGGVIPSNQWTHVAVTWKTGGKMIGYINGEQVFNQDASSLPLGFNQNDLIMGAAPWNVNDYKVDGSIDEVRIWDKARTQQEIKSNIIQTLQGNESGLVGYWDFQGNVNDKSKNNNNGELVGTTATSAYVFDQEIPLNPKVLNLKGSNDYVKVKNNSSLNLTNEITIEAWINVQDSNSDQKFIGKTDIGTGYVLGIINNGKLYPEFWDSNKQRFVFQSGFIPTFKWTHVAVTWKTGGQMIGYINGKEVVRQNASSLPLGVNQNDLIMGAAPWDVNLFKMNGSIDEVRIWDKARTQEEIQSTIGKTLQGTEANLVGYWDFQGNANDKSKNNNNGELVGTTAASAYVVDQEIPLNAKGGEDYLNSRYRKVSTDVYSERDGIIITEGQTTARIYFSALSDAIAEGDENVNIRLIPHNFDDEPNSSPTNSNYGIDSNKNSATITIKDNQAYKQGVILLDKNGQLISKQNPLAISNNQVVFNVQLSSQPTSNVVITLTQENGTPIGSLTFTPQNWDKSQTQTINSVTSDGKIAATSSNAYFSGSLTFDYTINAPIRVTEGSPLDAQPVTPEISIVSQGDITEDGGLSGNFTINLSAPAPTGGIILNYTVSGTANSSDYQPIDNLGTLTIPEGATTAGIPILPIADNQREDNETVTITLNSGSGYKVKTDASQTTITIKNDDQAGIEVVNAQLVGNNNQTYAYSNNLVDVVTNEPYPNLGNVLEIRDDRGNLLGSATLTSADINQGKVAVTITGTLPTDKQKLQVGLKENATENVGYLISNSDKFTFNGNTVEVSLPNATSQSAMGIRLQTKPTGNVIVTFADVKAKETSLDKPELTFTPDNWDVYQTVIVSGVDDSIVDGNIIYKIKAQVSSSLDPHYVGKVTEIEIKNLDDDQLLNQTQDLSQAGDNTQDGIVAKIGSAVIIGENAGTAQVQVTLSQASTQEVNVIFDTMGGSATLNQDYQISQKFLVGQFEADGRKRFESPLDNITLTGTGHKPTFADLDLDGDLDLVVGTQSNGILYFQNTGSASQPKFQAQTGINNPFNAININGAAPTFGDLDGNKTPDLIVGGANGSFTYYVNTGSQNNPRFTLTSDLNPVRPDPFANIKLDNNATPFLVDFDGDRDLDVISGGTRGTSHLTYYQNTGSKTNPSFQLADITGITAEANSVPSVTDWNGDGKLDIILGQQDGSVKLFQAETSGYSAATNLINEGLGGTNTTNQTNAAPTLADLDGDGDLDAFFANSTGINYYEQFSIVKFAPGETSKTINFSIIDDNIAEREEENVGSENIEGFKRQETIEVRLLENTGYRLEDKAISIQSSVTITDNDTPGVTIIPVSGNNTTSETGGSSSFTVKLNTQPLQNVTVFLGSQDETEGLLTVNSDLSGLNPVNGITFTPNNWNEAITFYVKGVDDQTDDGDVSYKIIPTFFSEDQNYHRLAVNPVTLINSDNDQAGFTITGAGKAVEGKENVYSVRLNTKPVGDVRLVATPTNDQIRLNNELVGEPHTLIFTPDNWNFEQTVRASALDDSVVEYLHFSEIAFQVETGTGLDFESKTNNNLAANALDLGKIKGGYRWTKLAISDTNDLQTTDVDWFKFSIADTGNDQDFVRINFDHNQGDLQLELYKTSDLNTPLQTSNSSNNSGTQNFEQISLNGQPFGEYYIKVSGVSGVSGATNGYDLLVADEDYQFTQATPNNIPVVIEDNDLPTVTIIPGETASEVFGQPSYFAFRINAPVPANSNGLKINYRLKGGSANLNEDINSNGILDAGEDRNGNKTLDLGDYQMQTEGFVRIAPGEIQNNLIVVPIDDKLIEAFELKVVDNPQNVDIAKGEITLKVTTPIIEIGKATISKSEGSSDFPANNSTPGLLAPNSSVIGTVSNNGDRDRFAITLKAGVQYTFDLEGLATNKGTLSDPYLRLYKSNGEEVNRDDDGGEGNNSRLIYTPTSDETLYAEVAGYSDNRTGTYKLTATAPGVNQIVLNRETEIAFTNDLVATIIQQSNLTANKDKGVYEGEVTVKLDPLRVREILNDAKGRIFEETVTVELVEGEGYKLAETKEATLRIQDDDVPGVRIVQVGDNTVVEEGQTATFKVSLLSEPKENVTIRLTPGSEIDFVNPINPTTVKVDKEVYSFVLPQNLGNLGFTLNSLVTSDRGKTIAFDVRFTEKPNSDLFVEFYDGNNPTTVLESSVKFTSTVNNIIVGEEEGNWNDRQQVIIGNLDRNTNGNLALIAKVKDSNGTQIGTDINLGINRTITQVDKQTTEITITPDKWFELKTVTITGTDEGVAEPGIYHESNITYEVISKDADYNNIFVPKQRIDVVDRTLNAEATAQSIQEGFTSLQQSMDKLAIPIVGSLKGKTPDLIGNVSDKLVTAISGQQNLSGNRLKSIIEAALKPLGLDFVKVSVDMTKEDIAISLSIKKEYKLFEFPLDVNLGLDALGIGLKTEGKLKSNFSFDIGLGFGLHKDFGFYIDTKKTAVNAVLKLDLDKFKGQGNLGPLRLDMEDDSQNPTELAITFKAGINDLDNYQTIKFLDVNGNGVLDADTFSYGISQDVDKDNKADKDSKGNLITEVRQVQEPFTQVNAKGKASPFPTVAQASNEAKRVNWNGNNSFDAPETKTNEGIYREKKDAKGNVERYYLDLNRNGKLDANSKEELLSVTPGTGKWFDNKGNIKPFQIQEKKVNGSVQYYFDQNGNNTLESNEELSKTEKSKIDKNNNNKLDGDVTIAGEGLFVQGRAIAFKDNNGNGIFDVGEPYVKSGFDQLKISGSDLKATFLDLNGDGEQAGSTSVIGNISIPSTLTEYFFLKKDDHVYLDLTEDKGFTEKYYGEDGKELSEPKLVKPNGQSFYFLDVNGDGNQQGTLEPLDKNKNFVDFDFSGDRNNLIEPIINRSSTYLKFSDLNSDGKQQKLIDFNRNGQKDDGNGDYITEVSIQIATNPNNTTFEFLDTSGDGYWTREHQVITQGNEKYLDVNDDGKKDDGDRPIFIINNPSEVKIEKEQILFGSQKIILDSLTGRLFLDSNKNSQVDDNESLVNIRLVNSQAVLTNITPATINYTGQDSYLTSLNGTNITYLDETGDGELNREYKVLVDEQNQNVFGKVLDINDNGEVDFSSNVSTNDPLIYFQEGIIREEKNSPFVFSDTFQYVDYNQNGKFDGNGSNRVPQEFKLITNDNQLYIDKNGNNQVDSGEPLAKAVDFLFLDLDDNQAFTVDTDLIVKEKEITPPGQGTVKLKFNDKDLDGTLDSDEALIYDSIEFLDLNGDSKYSTGDYLTKGKYFDINGNNINDVGEPQLSNGDWVIKEDNVITYKIVTDGGKTFIDQFDSKNRALNQSDKGTYQGNVDINLLESFNITTTQAKILGLPNAGSYTAAQILGLTVNNGSILETEITFVDLEGDKKLNIILDPIVKVKDGIRYVDADKNGVLTKNKNGQVLEASSQANNEFDTEDLKGTGKIIKLLDDGDRLTLTELQNWKNDKDLGFFDLFNYQFSGIANLGLKAQASIAGSSVFPKVGVDIGVGLPLFNFGNQSEASDTGLSVKFNNITLDFGTFLTKFATPFINIVDKIIGPVKPILKVLNTDTKIFSYLGLEKEFNRDSLPGVSVLDLAKVLAEAIPADTTDKKLKRTKDGISKTTKFIDIVNQIVDVSDALKKLVDSGGNIILELGSYDLDDFKGSSNDPADSAAKIDPNKQGNKASSSKGTPAEQAEKSNTASPEQKSALSKLKNLEGLDLPILTNPISLIRILLGEPNVDLLTYDIPDLDFFFSKEQEFLLYTPPVIKGSLELGFEAKTDLSVGYDTGGLEAWKADNFELSKIYKVLDGFYLNDWDSNGEEKDELSAKATLAAGLSASIVVAKAVVKGGLEGYLGFDVIDEGELQGKNDGKVRGSEIISRIKNPLQLFDLKGSLDAFLRGEIKIGFDAGLFEIMKTVWSKELARITVAKFNVGASGITFSSSLSNSYINAATVFFDSNFNGIWDTELEINGELVAEPITFTNEYGQYNLEIGLEWDKNSDGIIDIEDGQLIGIGGFDTSSGSEAGKFIGLPGSAIVTPLTSLQVPLVRGGLNPDQAGDLIKAQLGLDSNFDLANFDSLLAVGQDQSLGLDIYLAHIQVQALFNQGRALIDGKANTNNFQLVQQSFAQFLRDRSINLEITDSYDFSDAGDIKEFLSDLVNNYATSVSLEQIAVAAEMIATSNQLLDQVKDIGASKSIKEALPALASVKRVVQDDVAKLIGDLASEGKTITAVQAEFDKTLYQNYILVDGDINSFGNRSVSVSVKQGAIAEDSSDTVEFTIKLSHPAPNQGLTVLYSLSGTATLNEDYTSSTLTLGEAYIAAGETTSTISLSVSNDSDKETLESIVLNLKSTGEGFVLDPAASVALVEIIDNDQNTNQNSNSGLTLAGTLGDDSLTGDVGDDTIEGLYGNDTLDGQAGNDFIQGGHGADSLTGGAGDDVLEGNFGNDIIQGNDGKDIIRGGSGDDQIFGGNDSDAITGGVGNDTIDGGDGNDQIKGEGGNDLILGGADNDWLLGNDGNDILFGGTGDDLLNGGPGADVFYFSSDNEGFDTIFDFNPDQGDKIQVSASGFGITDLSKFRFISGVLDYDGENLALIQNKGDTYSYFPDLSKIIEIVDQPTFISLTDTITGEITTTPPQLDPVIKIDNPEITILDDIIARGKLLVAESEFSSDFDLEFVRAISTVLFGDADKFELVVEGEDIGATRYINNVLIPEDTDLSPVYFYDHQAVVVRKDSGINNGLDLDGRMIGLVEAQAGEALSDTLSVAGINYSEKYYDSIEEMVAAYDRQEIDAYTTDSAVIYQNLANLSDPDNHQILDVEFAKVPVSLFFPKNDSQLGDVIRWTTYVPIQAEEFGINSQNINQFLAINTDANPSNDSSPEIRRFLGIEGNLGATLGLPNDFAVNIVTEVGNYAEIYNRHFEGLQRGRNLLARDGGLLYSPPFSGTVIDNLELIDNDNRDVLQEVLERGFIKVGINGEAPGFSQKEDNGEFKGFDVDLGRAIAAALFGNPDKIEFVVQDNVQRFTNVANGIVDISASQATYNLVRDASLGVDYSPIYLYTGQGIMVRKNSGISNLAMLNGRKVGVVANTTSQQNIEDKLFELGATAFITIYDTEGKMLDAYEAGEIDAISNDLPLLSAAIPTLSKPEEHFVLDEVLSKEPLAMVIDENQSRWMEVVSAVYTALVQAEEYDINKDNIDQKISQIIINNNDDDDTNDSTYALDYFLGLDTTIANKLKSEYDLPIDFAVNAIKAVGNYGEIYNRHFNDDILRRDTNALSSEYGLQYALPLGLDYFYEPDGDNNGESQNLRLKITLANQNTRTVNEIGIVLVDDEAGSINGFKPGEDGYVEAALSRGKIIFSPITNLPNGFSNSDLQKFVEFNTDASVRFFYVENSTIESVRRGNTSVQKVIFSDQSSYNLSNLGTDGISITWNNLEIRVQSTTDSMILGTKTQNQPEGEVIHLQDLDVNQKVNVEFSVFREAAYDNYVGFYQVVDEVGGIDTDGDGIANINPGDDNYIQTAINNRIQGIDLTVSNQGSAIYNDQLLGGAIYAPFIIVDGNPDDINSSANDPQVYFTYLGANSDGKDHIRMLGNNVFGFEDLPGGGDLDYNDMIISAKLG